MPRITKRDSIFNELEELAILAESIRDTDVTDVTQDLLLKWAGTINTKTFIIGRTL